MARQHIESQFGAFAFGIVVGLVFKEVVKELYEYVRSGTSRRARVVTYPQNLPDSLERREPVAVDADELGRDTLAELRFMAAVE